MAKNQSKHNESGKDMSKNQKSMNKQRKSDYNESGRNYFLIPIFFVIAIIPFIVKLTYYNPKMSQFPWFVNSDSQPDMFLYYRHWYIIIIAGIMAVIIALKAYYKRYTIKFIPVFIPLSIYALLILGSTIFSKYATYSYIGSFEQFESVFVLLGYCIIAFYSYLFINSEKDLKILIYIMIGAVLCMSVIGISQFVGHDILITKFITHLILPSNAQGALQSNFEEGRVYLTLYNPNYVGVYASLFVPVLLVLALFVKNVKIIILSGLGIIGLIISVIGSKSLTGFICIIVSFGFLLLFSWRQLIKRIYITLPVVALLIISLFVINSKTDQYIVLKLKNVIHNASASFNTTTMDTNKDNVSLTYKGNILFVQYITNENQTANIVPYDENFQQVECSYDEAANVIQIIDERFSGISLGVGSTAGVFYIAVDGKQYNFTNQSGDGSYYFYNSSGKWDKMITAPSEIFTGYESFASFRGYIWSRTIPLLKNYIILGSGPDTYTLVYPQNDYLNLINSGFSDSVLTKPHSMYLQMAVQTGVLSLVVFLLFYGMYFVSSILIYKKGSYGTLHEKVGVAIFIGTVSYMISGITNDSSVTTAPLFWAVIGIGISINYKVKTMNKAELEMLKRQKAVDK